MRILTKSSENEMVALFLRGEIKSERYGNKIEELLKKEAIQRAIITSPNLKNDAENKARKLVLKKFRGYGSNTGIFKNFPKKVDWHWAVFDKDDIQKIKYITYDYWEELSNGTRYAKDSVITIQNRVEIFGVSNSNFIRLSEHIKNGGTIEPLIVLAPLEKKDNMIVLEGHARLTAINLVIEYITEIKMLLGFAGENILNKWDTY